jgi:hypothetical protein
MAWLSNGVNDKYIKKIFFVKKIWGDFEKVPKPKRAYSSFSELSRDLMKYENFRLKKNF